MLTGRQSSYIVVVIVYEWQRKDKRPQRSNVNAKNLLQNSQYLWRIVFSRRSSWVLLELVGRWTQHFSEIDHKMHKIGQIYIWNPMTTGFTVYYLSIDLRHQYGISVVEWQTFLRTKRPQWRRARRNGCFCRLIGALVGHLSFCFGKAANAPQWGQMFIQEPSGGA